MTKELTDDVLLGNAGKKAPEPVVAPVTATTSDNGNMVKEGDKKELPVIAVRNAPGGLPDRDIRLTEDDVAVFRSIVPWVGASAVSAFPAGFLMHRLGE